MIPRLPKKLRLRHKVLPRLPAKPRLRCKVLQRLPTLLNKLGPLVAKSPNEPYGPSGYGPGATLPSFILIFQNPGQVIEDKSKLCLSPRESLNPKREE